jgi:hypothetical protein
MLVVRNFSTQNIPADAVFLVKKTGIIDEFVGPFDFCDNHFLYIQVVSFCHTNLTPTQLPSFEGFILKKAANTDSFHKYWIVLKENRYEENVWLSPTPFRILFFDEEAHTYIFTIPIGDIVDIMPSDLPEKVLALQTSDSESLSTIPFAGCGFDFKTSSFGIIHCLSQSPSKWVGWAQVLHNWRRFLCDNLGNVQGANAAVFVEEFRKEVLQEEFLTPFDNARSFFSET